MSKNKSKKTSLKMAVGAALVGAVVSAAIAIPMASDNEKVNQLTHDLSSAQVALSKSIDEGKQLSETVNDLNAKLGDIIVSNDNLKKEVATLSADVEAYKDKEVAAQTAAEAAAQFAEATHLIDGIELDGNFKETVTYKDLPSLFKGKVYYDGDNYDVEETIVLTKDVAVLTSKDDKDLKARPALGFVSEGAVQYNYVFEDAVEISDEPLEIKFLGKDMSIVEADSGDESITVLLADKFDLDVGASVSADGKVIVLESVSENKAAVSVDGVKGIVQEGQTKTVNGVQIYADTVFDTDIGKSFAVLYVGDDAKETIANGDEFDADDRFEWVVEFDGDKLSKLGLVYVEENKYADDDVLLPGDSLVLPNEFAKVSFEGYSEKYDSESLDVSVKSNRVEFKFSDKRGVSINGEEADNGEFEYDGTNVKYDVDGDEKIAALSDVVFEIDDREVTVIDSGANYVVFSNDIGFEFDFASREITKVHQSGKSLMQDEDYLTVYGDVVQGSIEDKAEDGRLELTLLSEQAEVEVRVQ